MKEDYDAYRERVHYGDEKAERYAKRKVSDGEEFRLVDRAFQLIPKEDRILDVPCGGGRISIHLAKEGFQMHSADYSDAMVKITSENIKEAGLSCPVEKQDIENLSCADGSYDTVLSFRLFHHFPQGDIRERAIGQMCRVASKRVVLSYYNPWSVNYLRRRLKGIIRGKHYTKYGTPLSEVKGYFEANGYRLVQDFADRRWFRPLHIAVFERTT